jgi:hypothetical protein
MDNDDDKTPTDIGIRRPATHEARAIADLGLALAAIAVDIGTSAGRLDQLEGAERAGFLAGLARQLGEIGDALHDARRVCTNMLNKEPP